uniref:Si:ch211-269k10.2 n=1 Tax=Salmo trutta TaxID=8032 RepID=A0A674CPE4_SALTR
MEHCQDYFRQLNLDSSGVSLPSAVLEILQDYQMEASTFSLDNFSPLNDMVLSLDSPRQTHQWNLLWTKCQQTKNQLEETLVQATAAATAASDSAASGSAASDSAARNLTKDPSETADRQGGCTHTEQHGATAGDLVLPELPTLGSRIIVSSLEEETKPHSTGHISSNNNKSPSSCSFTSSSLFPFPPAPEGDPLLLKLRQSPSLFDDTDSDCTIDSLGAASCHSEPVYSSSGTPLHHLHHHHQHRKQPLKKIMKKTLSYELPAAQDGGGGHVDTSHLHGYTGVYIKGLEVANNVSVEKKLQRPDVVSPALGRSRSMSSPTRHPEGDGKKHSSKVQHIMAEMISTEREYVRSLSYVIEHYFPEMERLDLPQDLWGKRSIIFGNMEKLCNFHCQYFLKELEASAHSPLSISSCFLRHEDQFGMYALYSKNKPQSDALLTSHGNGFFKNKQLELGDKMDLASYLLKPIQRMSKYALLLKDLIKECGQSQEQELSDLRTAEEMVKFQLRHGNDLLAMDAIRGCDVNLKEQGQLRCQDEFIVWCGRRKYLRHVFLFEDLILFSKSKKIEGGYDLYIYKQSYKTAEIGMTESVGDSGLRFEIWFRRRKSQDHVHPTGQLWRGQGRVDKPSSERSSGDRRYETGRCA